MSYGWKPGVTTPPTWREGIHTKSIEVDPKTGYVTIRLIRWKPNVPYLCGILMGYRVDKRVQLPPLPRRIELFNDGMDMIRMFGAYPEIVELAGYRRQVMNKKSVPQVDRRFFRLVCVALNRGLKGKRGGLTLEEVEEVALRMPPNTPIRRKLEGLIQNFSVAMLQAAE